MVHSTTVTSGQRRLTQEVVELMAINVAHVFDLVGVDVVKLDISPGEQDVVDFTFAPNAVGRHVFRFVLDAR